jgi:ribosomal protein S13
MDPAAIAAAYRCGLPVRGQRTHQCAHAQGPAKSIAGKKSKRMRMG